MNRNNTIATIGILILFITLSIIVTDVVHVKENKKVTPPVVTKEILPDTTPVKDLDEFLYLNNQYMKNNSEGFKYELKYYDTGIEKYRIKGEHFYKIRAIYAKLTNAWLYGDVRSKELELTPKSITENHSEIK